MRDKFRGKGGGHGRKVISIGEVRERTVKGQQTTWSVERIMRVEM